MKIRVTIGKIPVPFTTVGYWAFDGMLNKGTLHIYCLPMAKLRFIAAVVGHELIEALYCRLCGITTEECDRWDSEFEQRYSSGTLPVDIEPGDDPKCPYHRGHWLGCVWERVWIALTLAGWEAYTSECDRLYHEMQSQPKTSHKTLP